ncbi:uncharacterized protein LOC133192607 [Saccostrea echinata]|uniref:uncharacterized protein LOC133192607 n=1 Tax=Saccostrea echinata TaxID=191078 RepID=UPI002A81F7BA|nr:uncharacterized protein LOC133192607 [Saccostrea echinata]
MLKVIAFENFVHFKEKQVINLETATRKSDDKKKKKSAKETPDDKKKTAEGISDDTEEISKVKSDDTETTAKEKSYDTQEIAQGMPHDKQETEIDTFHDTQETAQGIPIDKQKTEIETSHDIQETAQGIPHDIQEKKIKGTFQDEVKSAKEQPHGTENKSKLACFVGANFCGKSTVLELIRRCMTNEINVTVTRSFNENKVAYVFCKFDLHSKEVISGVIKEGNECVPCKFHKILIYTSERGKILRCNSFESSDSTPNESFRILVEPEDKDEMKYLFQKQKKESTYVKHILKIIQSKQNIIEKKEGEVDWKDLENAYVATMPLRGIGMVQWTRSNKIGDKVRNYKMACEQAEIISELLSSESIDTDKETDIFDYLTYPQKFTFILSNEEDKIRVQHGGFRPFPLLKTSEGILEAKQVSLLLSHKNIKTLTLEEPCRGMHAQMIERLRTVLYQEGLEKTIIVSTHSPYFIDTSTINNTHVFFRTESKDSNYECNIRNVGLQRELSKVSDVETLRTLLFATKVLLVEGPTDRDVVQALFTHLRESRQKDIGIKEKSDITTYQIIPIGGCQNAKDVLRFCKYINLPCSCLLDRDKFVSIKYLPVILDSEDQIFSEWVVECFLGMEEKVIELLAKKYVWKKESDFLEEGFQELSDHLREKNIFVWKYGALEESILSTDKKNEHIAKPLKIDLSDPSNRCKRLKRKLKERLDEKERRCFAKHISEVEEIKRFLKFMEDEENTRMKRSGILSQEHSHPHVG